MQTTFCKEIILCMGNAFLMHKMNTRLEEYTINRQKVSATWICSKWHWICTRAAPHNCWGKRCRITHQAGNHRLPGAFLRESAQLQAARQGLSARSRFANANMILNLALCFSSPRYRVFRYRNCPFMTANTCFTLARTDDFWRSAFFALLCPLADSFLIRVGLRFCLYLIFLPCLFRTMAFCRFSAPIYPLSPYKFTSSCKNDMIICLFIPLLLQHILARFSMLLFCAVVP